MKKNRVLVTGGTGYIGGNLIERLVNENYEVHIIVRESSNYNLLKYRFPKLIVHLYDGYITSLINIFEKTEIDTVFHLAASCITEHKPEDIKTLIDSNILFGTQLLEAMIKSGVKQFINTGTYWQHYDGPEYNPVALYAATKEAFENILKYYIEAHGLKSITLKLYDTYGPNDSRSKIINLLYDTYKKNTALDTSPGYQLMDLVYIDDVVEAFICAKKLFKNELQGFQKTYFVTSQILVSLKDVVNTFEKVIGENLDIHWGKKDYRAREVLKPWNDGEIVPGWQAKVSLKNGLKKLVDLNSNN